jgi:hypothetical protein
MLFFEPVRDYRSIFPPEIAGIITTLAALGFVGGVDHDLGLINLKIETPLIERGGKVYYGETVAGWPRAGQDQA